MSEEHVERVLAGLRGVEAGPGLEDRVLGSLAAVSSREVDVARDGWPRRLPLFAGHRWVWGGAVMASLVVVGMVVGHARGRRFSPLIGRDVIARGGAISVSAENGVAVRGAEGTPARGVFPRGRAVRKGALTAARQGQGRVATRDVAALGDAAGVASFPAPPLPLTRQEQMLLRVVHRGDREEMALLDPAVRQMREMEEAAAFREFFMSSVTVATAEAAEEEQRSLRAGEPSMTGQGAHARGAVAPDPVTAPIKNASSR